MLPLLLISLAALLVPLGLISGSIAGQLWRRRRLRRTIVRLRQLAAAAAGAGSGPPLPFAVRGALDEWLQLVALLAAQADDPEAPPEFPEGVAHELAIPLQWHLQQGLYYLLRVAPASHSPRRRRELCGHLLLLREAPNSNLLPYLVTCLLDPDPAVAGAATLAIGQNPHFYPGAAVPVATALREGSPRTVYAHSWCLGQILEIHPELVAMVENDPSPRVRRVIASTAARLLERARGGGGRLRDSFEPLLVRATQDPDPTVRALAYAAFRYLDSPQCRARCEAGLRDPLIEVRSQAVAALAAGGGAGGLARLVRELPEAAPAVRRAILVALEGAAAEVPIEVLTLVHRGPLASRRWAIEAIGALGGAAEVDGLVALLGDERPELRVAAANALGTLAVKPQALPALGRAVRAIAERCDEERDFQVVMALAETLAAVGDEAARTAILARLATAPDALRERLLETLARCEQSGAPDAAPTRSAP